jgi:phenylacetate-CoA ligase
MNARLNMYLAMHGMRLDTLPVAYTLIRAEDEAGQGHRRLPRRLGGMLAHAWEHVPYYRDVLPGSPPPPPWNDLGGLQDYLDKVPLLTKDILRASGPQLCATAGHCRRTYRNTSGGSTGVPVLFRQDQRHWDITAATQMRNSEWYGRRFGEPELFIWGSEIDVLKGQTGLRMRAANALSGRQYFNAFLMTESNLRALFRNLTTTRWPLIVAYTQTLYEIARLARQRGLKLIPPGAIVVTAETLHEFMRTEIEDAFGAPVYNRYGSREVGDIAAECPEARAMHVFPWTCYVEIVDEDGRPLPPGEEGEVAITSLTNRSMPLIRYRIGDRGALLPDGRCGCGRAGQRMVAVTGRSTDMFRRRDGGLVDGKFFLALLHLKPWIRTYQIVQRDYDWVEILVVPNGHPRPCEAEVAELQRDARIAMDPDCRVDLRFVDDLARSGSGKWRYTISHVTS